MRPSKETKFGYGFLLVGAGVPFLVDKLLGPSWATGLAVVFTALGAWLLFAGHTHKDEPSAKVSPLGVIVAVLLIAATIYSIWRLHRTPMSSESARVVEITKHAVPSIATEVKFLTLPIQIQPSITIYIVWLDSQKEPFYETVPNEGTTPIRIPLSVDIKRDGGIDEVVRYGFKNKGNSYLLGANLTFNVIFIEAIKHVTKQRDKTTKSLTVPFIPDALGSRAGAGTFLNGVTTTYTPGAMIMSRRETVEINSLPPLSMAWVYFVNRGNTFAKIYFPDIVQNATVDGNNWPSITINKPAQFGELKPAAHHWGNVTVEKP